VANARELRPILRYRRLPAAGIDGVPADDAIRTITREYAQSSGEEYWTYQALLAHPLIEGKSPRVQTPRRVGARAASGPPCRREFIGKSAKG
jgi:hypothetical protein